ncbi:SgcJ/EcaC family oxidoreductase [Nonomuraea sp. NPDC050783]|uniref:SgcJ/EcaC family oxidoreductase n=1 Tax=Nonomuraea sp. NPDC050783 TaxID=3154634 RepID=UPI0034658927
MNNAGIHELFTEMEAAWAESDAERFARVFASDADFISVRCDRIDGRAAIAAAHARLFATVYAGTRLTVTVRRVRHRAPRLAIAHLDSALLHLDGSPAPGLGGNPGNTMHAQAVLEHNSIRWHITSFMNMVPLPRIADR